MKRTGRVLAILLALAMLLSVSAFAAWNGIGGAWNTHNGTVEAAPTDAAPTVAKIAMKNSGSGWDGTYALGGMASDGGYMVFGNDYNYLYIVK